MGYEGVRYSHLPTHPPTHPLDFALAFEKLERWEVVDTHPLGSEENGLRLKEEGKEGSYFLQVKRRKRRRFERGAVDYGWVGGW